MPPLRRTVLRLALAVLCGPVAAAHAIEPVQLTIRDHRFSPDSVTVPTGVRFKIEVSNQDATPAEFESTDLKAEKIVVPGGKISVFVGPLKPGTYSFFDEYHPETAKGTMTAVDGGAKE